jgi:DNA repair exonuclease SbcCD ATPase subunit
MLARVLADHSLAGRRAQAGEVASAYQPDHLITRLEDATARLNELAPGDEGDTPRLEAAIERVADLMTDLRASRDREAHIRNWALHGLRRIEDLTTASNTHVLYISSDAVKQIIAETREQAYTFGDDRTPEHEAALARVIELRHKLNDAETILAELQGELSKTQRERDEARAAQAGQAEALQHIVDELRAVRRERTAYERTLNYLHNMAATATPKHFDATFCERIMAKIEHVKGNWQHYEPAS